MQKKGLMQEFPLECRGIILSSYAGLEKRLPHNFSEMGFEELVKNYNRAERVIEDVYSLTIEQFVLCMNDSGSGSLKRTIDGLIQYQSDMIHYFDSLREIKK
jgi:hypothetical protein